MTPTNGSDKNALTTISLGDLLDRQFPPREHLVAPWLRQGESAMLWADNGLGKTMLALSLSLAVAGGGELLGWQSSKPRAVLYVDGEMHVQDLRDRLATLAGTVQGCNMAAARRNLTVLSRQDQGGDVAFPDLAQPGGRDKIIDHARAVDAELIVLDNFATLADVADENEAAAMSPVLAFLLRLKQDGRACILVHHSNKSGETFRGSSKLATTFEVIIGLTRTDGRRPMDGTGFDLTWTKFRGQPSPATRPFAAALEERDGALRWTAGAALGDEIATLIATVQSGRYGTQKEIATALEWDEPKVSRIKNKGITAKAFSRQDFDAWLEDARARELEPGRVDF